MKEEEQLEIRGIGRDMIVQYVMELGGKASNEDKQFTGSYWTCIVSQQESFRLFQSDIPKVTVIFQADNKVVLQSIITAFRKKTFRIGG